MSRTRLSIAAFLAAIVLFYWPPGVSSQIPLSPPRDAGQTVTPAYEGWYPNEDGTFTLSFGYFNRNKEEILEIPVGPNNFIDGSVAGNRADVEQVGAAVAEDVGRSGVRSLDREGVVADPEEDVEHLDIVVVGFLSPPQQETPNRIMM